MKFKFISRTHHVPKWIPEKDKVSNILARMIGIKEKDSVYSLSYSFEHMMLEFRLDLILYSDGPQNVKIIHGKELETVRNFFIDKVNQGLVDGVIEYDFVKRKIQFNEIEFNNKATFKARYQIFKNDKIVDEKEFEQFNFYNEFELIDEFDVAFLKLADQNIPAILKDIFEKIDVNSYSTVDEQKSYEAIQSQEKEFKMIYLDRDNG